VGDGQAEIPALPDLPGEALPNRYGFLTGNGDPIDPSLAIFPIVRYDAEHKLHLLGTGFFISTTGLFVTARHVLMATFDQKGRQQYPIGIVQFFSGGVYLQRPILRCAPHPTADVAVGVAAPMKRTRDGEPLTNPILTLTLAPPDLNARVMTFAYPKHVNVTLSGGVQIVHVGPAYYDGDISEYFPAGHDRLLLSAPCYQTSMIIHSGASGGPVFSRTGAVFGVNSTGIDGTDISFVSRINEIFELAIDDVDMGDGPPRSVPVLEIARAGHIIVRPPL
jgi:Trypsin-like peptidase domain